MGKSRSDNGAGAIAIATTTRLEEADAVPTDDETVRASFMELQALSKQWMEKEREGISLIESFQTALLATRAASASTTRTTKPHKPTTVMAVFLDGTEEDSATQMDPWLAEDLFAQIRELPEAFTALLERMYAVHEDTRTKLEAEDVEAASQYHPLVLTMTDYAQFIAFEVATFEAEYQHIEALLAMVSFAITTDQLRTLTISWSTSPFLDPERSREFRQRHDTSQKMRSRDQRE